MEDGNITSDNVFIPQYVFAHTAANITATSASVWINVTFDEEDDSVKKGITHNYNDGTNVTFTIASAGIYEVHMDFDFVDTAASPSANVNTRLVIDEVEVAGSILEIDTTKQNAEVALSHSMLVSFNAGDKVRLQFISSDTTVSLASHNTFGTHPDSSKILIMKIDN